MIKYIFLVLVIFLTWAFVIKAEERSYYPEATRVETLARIGNYNIEYAILVDYSLHSGRKRFFLYNLELDKIEKKYMVAHGEGLNSNSSVPNFSNEVGSLASSEGVAVLGDRAYSGWGIHIKYWLDGLEETNDNMEKRVVVLHSWEGIPNNETFPIAIAQSQGCFTVSDDAMRELDEFIQKQDNKKILIYTFK